MKSRFVHAWRKALFDAGFDAVVNLAMADSDNAIPNEGGIVSGLGMIYYHIPVPFNAPETRHLRLFFAVMESLRKEMVWVHCVVNYRVSAFLYLFQKWKGLSDEQARTAVLPSWEPDQTWQEFMKQSVNGLEL